MDIQRISNEHRYSNGNPKCIEEIDTETKIKILSLLGFLLIVIAMRKTPRCSALEARKRSGGERGFPVVLGDLLVFVFILVLIFLNEACSMSPYKGISLTRWIRKMRRC